jgi:hypothetical protein
LLHLLTSALWHTAAKVSAAVCPRLVGADMRALGQTPFLTPLRKLGGPKCCDAQHGFFGDVVGCYPRLEETHETA